jgi:hypothetical protein
MEDVGVHKCTRAFIGNSFFSRAFLSSKKQSNFMWSHSVTFPMRLLNWRLATERRTNVTQLAAFRASHYLIS